MNIKKRILFTIPNFDTAGSGKALMNIALGLDMELFEVHIMCKHSRGEYFKVVQQSGLAVHLCEYETPMRPIFKALYGCYKVAKVFRKIKPDIIHSFHYSADYSEALAARIAGIKWIYTKKNMSWGGASKNGWKLRTYLASAVAVQNTDMMQLFFKGMKGIFQLIPRGVNTKEYDPKLVEQLPIEPGFKLLICVANLVPIKGIEILIEAFSSIHAQFPEWKLLVVGDHENEYGKKMTQYVSKLSLQPKMVFTGKVPNVKQYLQRADVFILPTLKKGRMEGSPVSLLEAMSMEKVVLGSDIPGIHDQLAAFPEHLFEAGNSSQLAQKLIPIMQMKEAERIAMGEQFREHILQHFTIEKEIQNHQNLYLSII
jgi:glycosyltransferase involved in cell wall biosynthesis